MTKTPKTPKPKKARPTKDKANRPSPPDRDGDGKSGGSLKGNATAPAALGTDDAVLAEAQVAADGLATIILKAETTGKGASHPLGINGHFRHVATGIEVQVNAAELEALEASHIEFETVVPLETAVAAGAEGSSSAAEPAVEAPAEETPPVKGDGGGAPAAEEGDTQLGGEPAA